MKIEITQSIVESTDKEYVWSKDVAPEVFDELRLVGNLKAKVLISPEANSKWLVTGTLFGVQTLTCARTLELFDQPFETEIVVEVEKCAVGKQEFSDEDDDVFAYQIPMGQDYVDVSEAVRQLVLLQEPQHPVKNPDKDFIFETKIPDDEPTTDPRWDKLKALKDKMSKGN